MKRIAICCVPLLLLVTSVFAQSAPAGDKPSFKIGASIFGDFTYVASPMTKDVDGNDIHASSFNVSRAYVNVTGNLNHRISFRVTPDLAKEKLKYAYAQLSLDDWTTKGSWLRAGMHQTPYLDAVESAYRYRWQGTLFPEREGFLSSSDLGVSGRWVFPHERGDVQGGIFNGEGYANSETNDQKAFQIRASVRPVKGLRVHGFAVLDHYVRNAERQRFMTTVTYEHPRGNAGFDLLRTKDQSSTKVAEVEGKGWSAWLTPKLPHNFEVFLRHDDFKPDTNTDEKHRRNIVGVAYWVPNLDKVTAAVMLDRDSLERKGLATPRPDDTRYGVKLLINF